MTESTGRWLKLGLGIGVSVACIAFVLAQVDADALFAALRQFQWPFMILALISLAIDYTLRVVRWSIMLRATGAEISSRQCAPAFLGSMALNNLLPLRAGDIVRALVFPRSMGISRSAATASLVLERLVDLLALLLLLSVGLAGASVVKIPQWQIDGLLVLSVTGASLLAATILFSGISSRAMKAFAGFLRGKGFDRASTATSHLSNLFSGLSSMAKPRVLMGLMLLSILIWIGEAGLYYFVLKGFSISTTLAAALAIMAISTLATLVPSSPGYVGPFHLAAFSSVVLLGGSNAQAAGFAILAHLALWIPVTLAGLVGLSIQPGLLTSYFKAKAARQ